MDTIKKHFKKIPSIIDFIANILNIINQLPILAIVPFINIIIIISQNKALSIAATVVTIVLFLIYVFFLRKQNAMLKKDITNLTEELEERDKKFNALNERMAGCKEAFKEKEFTSVVHYLVYKDAYDNFRTDLRLLECVLDVKILEMNKSTKKGRLQFKWRLVAINHCPEPIHTAKFIYSGDENNDIDPTINIAIGSVNFPVEPTNVNMGVPGDDRFIRIDLDVELPSEEKITIDIEYIFEKYDFNKGFDRIWLVPDALGFSGMDSFCIRFYSDEKNKYADKKAVLEVHSLKGKGNRIEAAKIPFQKLEDNKSGFEAKRGKENLLPDCSYVLLLPENTKNKKKQMKK